MFQTLHACRPGRTARGQCLLQSSRLRIAALTTVNEKQNYYIQNSVCTRLARHAPSNNGRRSPDKQRPRDPPCTDPENGDCNSKVSV